MTTEQDPPNEREPVEELVAARRARRRGELPPAEQCTNPIDKARRERADRRY